MVLQLARRAQGVRRWLILVAALMCTATTPTLAQQVVAPWIAWSDMCNVLGYYGSGPEVCAARKAAAWNDPASGQGDVIYVQIANVPFGNSYSTQQYLDVGRCDGYYSASAGGGLAGAIGQPRQGFYCPYGYSINGVSACGNPGAPENGYMQGYVVPQNIAPPGNEIRCTRNGPDPDKNRTCILCAASAGNPINIGFASKFERTSDLSANGVSGLSFNHSYNSRFTPNDRNSLDMSLGRLRPHPFGQRISVAATVWITTSWALRPDGNRYAFNLSGGQYLPEQDIVLRLVEVNNGQGIRTGWTLTDADDSVEYYDATGRLQSITSRTGVVQTMAYNGSGQLTTVTDSFGRTLTFTYYASNAATGANNIATVTDHFGNVVSYAYDTANNLSTVTYPGGGVKTYLYNEQAYTANTNLPNALTGITDENGVRFATYQYDTLGRAISTEHAGAVQKYQLNYVSPYAQTIVTDPLGTARSYNFQTILGVVKTTGVDQPCPTCGNGNVQATSYDANGNIASRTDFNGVQTTYTYDLTRNLETSRTEAVGTPSARTIGTTWHATYRLPLTITEPAAAASVGGTAGTRFTQFTYDASGNLLQKDVSAPKNDGSGTNETRSWKWTYNTLGQVLTATDPLNQTTTTAYYTATDTAVPPKWTLGDVQSVTNAAGHVTTFNAYDKNGRLLKMTDPNGLISTMSYHPRGWLTSRSVDNGSTVETTFYSYDDVGQLTRVVQPDGSSLFYAYDDAHRLVGMSEQQSGASLAANGALRIQLGNLSGNKILYTLDNMGNRTGESNYDTGGTLAKTKSRIIDSLNRLQQDIGGTTYASAPTSAITQYGYDNNGNLTTTTDPLSRVTTNSYDALNRLTSVIDPYNGASKPTAYQYDTANNLVQGTDPKGLATRYTYNGHNNLITQDSPDTGITQMRYDSAGNLSAKLDAGEAGNGTGRCTVHRYDALNRIASTRYFAASNTATNTPNTCFADPLSAATLASAAETITYSYDTVSASEGGAGGVGRLTRLTDGSGSTVYVYDKNGRVLKKTQTVAGTTNPAQSISYTYNAAGQLASLVTPSGQGIVYSYGAPGSASPGRVTGLSVNGVDVVKGVVYEPFGPNGGWSWGNHGTLINGSSINQHLRVFDRDYRPTVIASDPQGYSRSLVWDAANRIVQQNDGAQVNPNAALSQSYGYDALDRLTGFTPGVGSALTPQQFSYDPIGNRLTLKLAPDATASTAANTQSYVYASTNHRLQSISGQSNKAYGFDASGNLITESGASSLSYTVDAKNRVQKVQVGPNASDTVSYVINALGQRVRKLANGAQASGSGTASATATSKTARFIYDERGRLLGEYDDSGRLIQETVWFDDLPVTTLRPKGSHAGNATGIAGGQ
jgi:YD repeat-containing protein